MKATVSRFTREIPHPVQASGERHEVRTSLFLMLEAGDSFGVAEIAPQNKALNGDAGVDEVLEFLREIAIPRFLSVRRRNDDVPHWARVPAMFGTDAASRMASALIEGAAFALQGGILDVALAPGIATGSLLGTAFVPEQTDSMAMVRLKVGPDVRPEAFDLLSGLDIPVILDYNAVAPAPEIVLEHVALASVHVPVAFVEQVVAVGDFNPPSRLFEAGVRISLDESIRTIPDIRNVARYGSATTVCIKPARVGGRALAKSMVAEARELGIDAYFGGFFETALGRLANAALADELHLGPSDTLLSGSPVSLEDASTVVQRVRAGEFEAVGVYEVPET